MFRSLHSKLFLVTLLLITSLMAVVGTFLMTGITSFYVDEFYARMREVFGTENADFVTTLREEAAQPDAAARLQLVLDAYSGSLGVDSRNRNYYIFDGSGVLLATSDNAAAPPEQTANLLAARNGKVGDGNDITADYMDVAIPISGGENRFIIYIRDNRETVNRLNGELLLIILQAGTVGLLFSALMSFLLSKAMLDPIGKLTRGAERVAAGDFSVKPSVESNDEIGILTNTFNYMSSVLQSTLAAVENERSKLDTLFLHMTDGVVAYERGGELIHCNPAAADLLACRPEQCRYDFRFEEICPFYDVLRLTRSSYIEKQLIVGERYIELCFAPFSDAERGGVLVVLHDATEQWKTEERRREFVANVSHELRTPLTNIRSYAETMQDAELPPEMRESFLDVIIRETDRMTHIVQDLLTLSRLESGKAEIAMRRFSFSEAIESVLRSVQMEAKRRGHNLLYEPEGTLPEPMGDRGRIEQVMMNILGNAIKYTPDNGRIVVAAGSGRESVWFEVRDNGIGIPPEDRERIFERFYRVDKARSRESGGTGLGLSIAREIVQLHNGTLRLVERDEPGTCIRMELPLRQPTEAETSYEEQ